MEKFSLARITSDEIQEEELTEHGPRNRSPHTQEMKLDSNKNAGSIDESKFNENRVVRALKRIGSRSKSNLRNNSSKTENVKKSPSKLLQSFERLGMKLDCNKKGGSIDESKFNQKNENRGVRELKRIGSRSNSKLSDDSSKTENVKKSPSKLLQSFERLKSLTKIKTRNDMKSSKPEINSPKIKSKDAEALHNIQTSNKAQTPNDLQTSSNAQSAEASATRSIIKIAANEQVLNDTKKLNVKISEVGLIPQDVGVQYDDVCVRNKCPLDCKSILNAQKEQQAAEEDPEYEKAKVKTPTKPENEKAKVKTPTKKRCYLIRSKTREKIKSKSLSDLSESQKQKKKKEKKSKDAATKTESRKKCSKRSRTSTKEKKTTPPPSPKRKSKCYGQKQTQTSKQEKSEKAKLSEAKEDKKEEKLPVGKDNEKEAKASVEKDDKKEEKVSTGKDEKKAKSKKKTKKCYYYRKRSKVDKKKPEVSPVQPVLATSQPTRPTPPPTPQGTTPASSPKTSKLLTPQASIHLPPQEKPSSSPSILSRSFSLVQHSDKEEATPLTDISTTTVIRSRETLPSSTLTIPTTSRTTIPTTEISHETIAVTESDKEIPYVSTSELYIPSDEVQDQEVKGDQEIKEDQEVKEEVGITSPGRRRSCMMASPPAFVCNEDFKFPEFRERLNFTQNRGPIPPCLQPVLGPCEGRRCTILKGGERGQVCGVKYATVKITFFPEYTTYEVMRSTEKPPKCIPKCIEEVFVTKYEPKTQSP